MIGNNTFPSYERPPLQGPSSWAADATTPNPVFDPSQDRLPTNRAERRGQAHIGESNGGKVGKHKKYPSAAEKQQLASEAARLHFDTQRKRLEAAGAPLPDIDAFNLHASDKAPGKPATKSWLDTCKEVVSESWGWAASVNLIPGASAAPVQADATGTKTEEQSTDLQLFQNSVNQLRKAGVEKIFIAETHSDSRNVDVIAATVVGAKKGGADISFYRELNTGQDDMVEQGMNSPAQRSFVVENIVNDIVDLGHANPSGRGAKTLNAALSDKAVKLKLVSFNNPSRKDLKRFVNDKDFAIASMGMAHVMHQIESVNKVKIPWTGVIENIPAKGQRVPPFDAERQKENFNGHKRAQAKAPTAVIIQSQMWERTSREKLHQHYNGEGFIIMEVPFGKSVNATIIAPASTLEKLKAFAQEHGGRVFLLCKGIEGCDNPVAQKDDL